jgi:negative regulator of flagellin synthesis FlgM
MPNKIDPSLTPYRPVNGTGDSSRAREDLATTPAAGHGAAGGSHDTVEVTGYARQMASLEAAIASASGIDEARVDAIRAQVANGTYAVQPQQVADGLLRMDQVVAAST